jgi:hypothetical protein
VRVLSVMAAMLGVIGCYWPDAAKADLRVIIISESSLPFSMGPANFNNSTAKFDNSSANFANSVANFENSPANFRNSNANFENSISGRRRLFNESSQMIGYYVYNSGGMINFYNLNGFRGLYKPGGGHTDSIFSEDAWCGTLGNQNGQIVLGLSSACYTSFLSAR